MRATPRAAPRGERCPDRPVRAEELGPEEFRHGTAAVSIRRTRSEQLLDDRRDVADAVLRIEREAHASERRERGGHCLECRLVRLCDDRR
jgi:hypothetical protein